MVDTFQKELGQFLIDLAKFLEDKKPNPFVAISALEIAKHQFLRSIEDQSNMSIVKRK